MTYRGVVKQGAVILDRQIDLPDGTEVQVLPLEEGPTWAEVFKDIIGKAEGLPPDFARNHDHYLHGAPKK